MKIDSYEQAMEILHWVSSRRAYRRACGQSTGGPDYAADLRAEADALRFLGTLEN